MSGVGKSTVLAELGRRGYATVDTDDNGWIEVIVGEPLWREPLIKELLDRPREGPLFVQGTVANHEVSTDRPLAEVVEIVAGIAGADLVQWPSGEPTR